MKRLLIAVLMLGGCALEPPPPTVSALPALPDEWTAAAQPLPDIPACDALKDKKKRTACRADYDVQTRAMYVDEVGRRSGVVDAYERARLAGVQK